MDLVDLDLDSLFGDGGGGVFEEGEGDAEAAVNSTQAPAADEEEEDGAEMLARLNRIAKEGASKRKSATPRLPPLRFDAARLMGERGLPCLLTAMRRAPLTGREGRELDDLNAVLRAYEMWLHRLHPRFAFDDAAERLERLGRQMPVRTALKRVRAGLPMLAGVGEGDGEGDGEDSDDGDGRLDAGGARRGGDGDDDRDGRSGRNGEGDDSGGGESFALPAASETVDDRKRSRGEDSESSGESFALPEGNSRRPVADAGSPAAAGDSGGEEVDGKAVAAKRRRRPRLLADSDGEGDGQGVDGQAAAKRRRRPRLLADSEGEGDGDTDDDVMSDAPTSQANRRPRLLADSDDGESDGEGEGDAETVAKVADASGEDERPQRRRPAVIDSDDD